MKSQLISSCHFEGEATFRKIFVPLINGKGLRDHDSCRKIAWLGGELKGVERLEIIRIVGSEGFNAPAHGGQDQRVFRDLNNADRNFVPGAAPDFLASSEIRLLSGSGEACNREEKNQGDGSKIHFFSEYLRFSTTTETSTIPERRMTCNSVRMRSNMPASPYKSEAQTQTD